MKFSLVCVALALVHSTHGFLVSTAVARKEQFSPLWAMSAEEAALRVRAGSFQTPPLPPPSSSSSSIKLFEDDLLQDMQQCLLMLERRVRDGPGSLSALEVEELDFSTRRILQEMKLNEHNRPKPVPAAFMNEPISTSTSTSTSAPSMQATTVATSSQHQQQQPQQQQRPSFQAQGTSDISEDEGPVYDGKGGMGQPRGTVNTYDIPGMDEMSPEEYQQALQKSVSDRQKKRQETGDYGNRRATDYLNNLGKGMVAPGMVKKKSWDPKDAM